MGPQYTVETKILTLRYSPTLGGIDDTPLLTLAREHEILGIREHFFVTRDLPHLLCLISCRRRSAAQPAQQPATESTVTRRSRQSSKNHPPEKSQRTSSEPPADFSADQHHLYDAIRSWRASQAERSGVPRYVVLNNRDVEALVRQRPDSIASLRRLAGFGDAKVTQYGEALLALIHPGKPAPRLVTEAPIGTEPEEVTQP